MRRRYYRKRNPKARAWFWIVIGLLFITIVIWNAAFPNSPIMFHILFSVFLGSIIFLAIFLRSAYFKGKVGEGRVRRRLNKLVNKYGGYVINDIIIPGENNRTSQIDHVLITEYGVFVIETKNYSGRIYGKDNDRHWTQVLAYGHRKNELYNPVLQNATHIYRLNELTNNMANLISVVVFVNGNVDYIESDYVYSLRDLKHLIVRDDPKTISKEDVDNFYKILNEYKEKPIATTKEHVEGIKNMQRSIEHNICPRCGGKIIVKVNRNNGKQFWACENYPKCKFVKKN